MIALLNWRVWALIALLALGPISYLKGRLDGKKIVRLEWQVSVASANEDARRLEQRRQDRANEAAKLAADRDARIRAAADSARRESDGLRDDLDATRKWAAQSRSAADAAVRVTTDLLGRCSAEYLGMAESAARADSEARELRQAWPR